MVMQGIGERKERVWPEERTGRLDPRQRFMREEKGKLKGKYYVYHHKIMTDH